MTEQIKTEKVDAWFCLLLPFLLTGIGVLLFFLIPHLYDYGRMLNWESVDGKLQHAELVISHSSDSTTYSVDAIYQYEVNGVTYENDRVALTESGDNIGSFQEDLGYQLEGLLRNNKPVTVWFDPDNPEDAVLNKDYRWELLLFFSVFVVIFGGFGAGIIYLGRRGVRKNVAPEVIEKPWLADPETMNGVIHSDSKGGMIGAWVFATFWNLLVWPIMIFSWEELWDSGNILMIFPFMFPAIGLFLLYLAIKKTREWKRFGKTPLMMDPFPGAIGGNVGGRIQFGVRIPSDTAVKITLSSIYQYTETSGSGSNRRTSRKENLLWQIDGYGKIEPTLDGSDILFRFAIPEGLQESEEASSAYHLWRLNVHSEAEELNIDRSFELPVYKTGESSRRLHIDTTKERPLGVAEETPYTLLPLKMMGSGTELFYPMFRRKGRNLALILFGLIFLGMGIGIYFNLDDVMRYIIGGMFSLAGGSIVLFGLYLMLNSLRVFYDSYSLDSVRMILGIPVSRKQILLSEIYSIEIVDTMKSNNGSKHEVESSIVAHGQNIKITLVEGLTEYAHKEKLKTFFEEQLLRYQR